MKGTGYFESDLPSAHALRNRLQCVYLSRNDGLERGVEIRRHHVGLYPSVPQTVEKVDGAGEYGELVGYLSVTHMGEHGVAGGTVDLPSHSTLPGEDYGPFNPGVLQIRSCTGSQPRSARTRSRR